METKKEKSSDDKKVAEQVDNNEIIPCPGPGRRCANKTKCNKKTNN